MNILVTGCEGHIGRTLSRELRKRGHTVVGCDLMHRATEAGFTVFEQNSEPPLYQRCDIAEYRQLERLFDYFPGIELVYNCAAEFGRWNGEDFYEQLWKTNVIGMKHILRLQTINRFKLVHFSSSEIYGDYPATMQEEVTRSYALQHLNDYAMTKRVNEEQIRNHITQHNQDLATIIVRPFNIYGPGELYSPYRSVNVRFLYAIMHDWPIIVYKDYWRASTYIDDAINALANIATSFQAGEVYNIGTTIQHSIAELAMLCEKVVRKPSTVIVKEKEQLTCRRKTVDNFRAARDLDYKDTVNLENGLYETFLWLGGAYGFPPYNKKPKPSESLPRN